MGAAVGLPGFSVPSWLQPVTKNALYPWMGQKLRDCRSSHLLPLQSRKRNIQQSLGLPHALPLFPLEGWTLEKGAPRHEWESLELPHVLSLLPSGGKSSQT